jgi:twitching motility two-component system response regulator PilH
MATILIVDDSPTEVHVISQMLLGAGFQVISANDGETGIAMAKSEKPDAILMDVVMPGLNGFQATRELSRDPETSSIPVILVTTKDQDTDKTWGMRQGAKDYVVKPVSADLLVNKIKGVL